MVGRASKHSGSERWCNPFHYLLMSTIRQVLPRRLLGQGLPPLPVRGAGASPSGGAPLCRSHEAV
jgi:hypothetical protein